MGGVLGGEIKIKIAKKDLSNKSSKNKPKEEEEREGVKDVEYNSQISEHMNDTINTVANGSFDQTLNEGKIENEKVVEVIVAAETIVPENREVLQNDYSIETVQNLESFSAILTTPAPELIVDTMIQPTPTTIENSTKCGSEEVDDIELVIDLDNDFCEIIDTTTTKSLPIDNNNDETTIMEQNDEANNNCNNCNNSNNEEDIIILDLDSNQTIIKNSNKTKFIQNKPPPMPPITTTTTTTHSYLGSNSKLIFVNSSTTTNSTNMTSADINNKQFQVHVVTPQQPQGKQPTVSNSEIIITKCLNSYKKIGDQ